VRTSLRGGPSFGEQFHQRRELPVARTGEVHSNLAVGGLARHCERGGQQLCVRGLPICANSDCLRCLQQWVSLGAFGLERLRQTEGLPVLEAFEAGGAPRSFTAYVLAGVATCCSRLVRQG
jgi:hypothetical protein